MQKSEFFLLPGHFDTWILRGFITDSSWRILVKSTVANRIQGESIEQISNPARICIVPYPNWESGMNRIVSRGYRWRIGNLVSECMDFSPILIVSWMLNVRTPLFSFCVTSVPYKFVIP